MTNQTNIAPEIFRKFPSTDPKTAVVHFARLELTGIELGYAAAARRIAKSVNGSEALDDLVLIPFMYLWRHAIELTLKGQILHALKLRSVTDFDGAKAELERLDGLLKRKHNLQQLAQELAALFRFLGLEPLPADTQRRLAWLAQSDQSGQAFRYAGEANNDQSYIDFPKLAEAVEDIYEMVSSGADMMSEYEGYLQDHMEEQQFVAAEARAEFEAEMRAEYEAEMLAAYGNNISW